MKKNYSISISLILGMICAINLPQSTLASSFNDVSSHWAKDSIERIENFDIINGFNGDFRPNSPITRGELAVILDKVMVYQNKAENQYKDLDNSFYTDPILKLTKANIISGYNNEVRPKDYISREEAATMIARAFNMTSDSNSLSYKDSSKISEWAIPSVSVLTQEGIITGNNSEFRPKDNITRAEVITILNNILGGYYKSAGTFSNENIDKTVVVSASDVNLENMTIEKDLIISAGVGEGDVTLTNVNVKGKTIISGGGKHSIHVEGNSSLENVEIAKDGEPIRIVAKDNANIGNIVLTEQNADTIIEGNVDSIQSFSSNKQLEIRGQVNNLSLNGDNSSVNLTQNGKIENIDNKSSNNGFNLDKGTSISNIKSASNVNIKGEGKVTNIQTNSTQTNSTQDNSSSNLPMGGGSGSLPNNGNNNNNNDNKVEKPKIVSVESVENGLVRFKLDKPFNVTKDKVSIICTSGGSDMTVLNVKTSDNITFDVTTAYYKDNTYSLAITFEDNTITEKSFEVRSLAPTISSVVVERKTDNKANILYQSDTPGKFYYVLKEDKNTRLRSISNNYKITEEYVVKNGTALNMKYGGNNIELNDLKKDTSYTMYYVAEDLGENRTVLKQISITSKSENLPENSVEVLNAEGFYKNNGFFKENHWFEFKLSNKVEVKLEDFSISCPRDGKLTLGRLETTDNINYKVYMKPGYIPSSDNTYTVQINLPDGNIAKKSFFVDFSEPYITGVNIVRSSDTEAKVTFNSTEAGTLYWKVLDSTDVPSDTTPKDPNKIINDGNEANLYEGPNVLPINNFSGTKKLFCFVSKDTKGNIMQYYDYHEIPDDITKPEIPNPGNKLDFRIVNISHNSMGTNLEIESNEPKFEIRRDYVEIKNKKTNQVYTGYKYIDTINPSSGNPTITVKNVPAGDYELKLSINGKTGTQDFTIHKI